MAETRVVNLEVKDNSEEAAKAFEKLSRAIDKTEKSAHDLDATFEEVYGDLKPLTARMGEAEDRLYEMSLAGQQATQEYKDLLVAVGNYKKVQQQTDLVVDAAAQTLDQKLGGALQGATSAFAGVQGVMGLMGSESEELEKALLKVQSAMALAEGVRGVREALPAFSGLTTMIKGPLVKAFTTLKGAIITTGIGALVVALALAADAMGLFSDATADAAEEQEKLNTANEKSLESINKVISQSEKARDAKKGGLDDLKQELELLRAKGATEEEIYNKSKAILDKEAFNLKVRIKSYDEKNKKELEASWEAYYQLVDVNNKKEVLEAQYQKSISDKEEEADKASKERRKQKNEDLKAKAKEAYEIEKARIQNLKNLENEFLAELEKAETEYYDSKLTAEQLEIQNTQDKFFELIEKAKQYNQDIALLEQAQKDSLAEINERYRLEEKVKNDEVAAKKKEDDQKLLENEKALQDAKYEIVNGTFSAIAGLAEAFAGTNEAQQKRAFKIQKAAGIAQATVDTYKSATAAYASQLSIPTPDAPIRASIAAGVAIVAGLANVKKIASQEFGGGASGGGGNVPTPNLSTPQSVQPNFNIVGDSGVNQLDALKSQPSKVYVVSGEVSSAQALDRNRIRNATF